MPPAGGPGAAPPALRRVAAVSRAETGRWAGGLDRRMVLAVAALAAGGGLLGPVALEQGLDFDRGLYALAASADSPLLPAARESALFQVALAGDPAAEVEAGRADLGITRDRAVAGDSAKARAAVAALEQAARDHAYRRLRAEPDQAAAFPVRVEVRYVAALPAGAGGAGLSGQAAPAPPAPVPGPGPGTAGGIAGGAPGVGGTAEIREPRGFLALLPPERDVATPETLAPPFPFRSLVLAYLFLVPMNFVVQAYGGSAIAERLNRRGEALLASPARTWELLAGRALPYLALMMALAAVVAGFLGAGPLTLAAVLPVALAFLALEFLAAMVARSFRELTFLTVFVSVLLTVYLFLPAAFAGVHPVAFMSPVTLVVQDLRGAPVTLAEGLYATVPLTALAAVLFLLGAGLHREEDLFHQKPVRAKVLDALARQVRGPRSGFKLAVMAVPLVLVVELLAVSFLFAASVPVALAGTLLAVAVVEEAFKAAPAWAALSRGALAARRAVRFGAWTGAGFFAAEKGFLLASAVGLHDLAAGQAVFGAVPGGSLPVVAALLAAPLGLHVATAGLTAWGAARGRAVFGAAFLLAVAVHGAYNYVLLAAAGGG